MSLKLWSFHYFSILLYVFFCICLFFIKFHYFLSSVYLTQVISTTQCTYFMCRTNDKIIHNQAMANVIYQHKHIKSIKD